MTKGSVIAALAAAVTFVLVAQTAFAQYPPPQTNLVCAVNQVDLNVSSNVLFAATLRDAGGKAISGQAVSFSRRLRRCQALVDLGRDRRRRHRRRQRLHRLQPRRRRPQRQQRLCRLPRHRSGEQHRPAEHRRRRFGRRQPRQQHTAHRAGHRRRPRPEPRPGRPPRRKRRSLTTKSARKRRRPRTFGAVSSYVTRPHLHHSVAAAGSPPLPLGEA